MNILPTKKYLAATVASLVLPLFSCAVNLFLISACASAANEQTIAHSKTASTSSSSVSANYLGKVNKLPNRGFVKNPSAELTAKFPMCDDFLNVEWLDKENGYGYLEHDLYLDGKLLPPKKSLIYIHGKEAKHLFDLNKYEPYGQFDKVIEAIKKGEKVYSRESTIPAVEYQGKQTYFLYHDYINVTYANNHQNVCIPYPDNQRMWLVELRSVKNVFDPLDIEEKSKKLANYFPRIIPKYLINRGVTDINYDGVEDYISGEAYIFSAQSAYKLIAKLGYEMDSNGQYFIFGIKGTDKVCKIYDYQSGHLTTDGNNYFLSTTCNLTQLSTQ